MEAEYKKLKNNVSSASKAEADKLEKYMKLMKKCNVVE